MSVECKKHKFAFVHLISMGIKQAFVLAGGRVGVKTI